MHYQSLLVSGLLLLGLPGQFLGMCGDSSFSNPTSLTDEQIVFAFDRIQRIVAKFPWEKLGGDITIKSTKDSGSTFIVTIDAGTPGDQLNIIHTIDENTASENKSLYNIPKSLSGHILLAEDSIDNQELISKYILKTGLTLDVVGDGKQALEKAGDSKYDLILMDVQMPVMDGLEAIRKIRENGNKIPIICLTANAMLEDKNRCFESGADEYLTKPLNFSHLNYVLSQFISHKEPDSEPLDTKLRANSS